MKGSSGKGIMPTCTLLEHCTFFKDKMVNMPFTAALLKTKYCAGSGSSTCARYLLYKKLGEEKVPHDLLPDQVERVEEIMADGVFTVAE